MVQKKTDQQYNAECINLGNKVHELTGLVENVDYKIIKFSEPRTERPFPKDWAKILFIKTKGDKTLDKKNKTVGCLTINSFETQDTFSTKAGVYQICVRISNTEPIITPKEEITEEKPNYQFLLNQLDVFHKENGILGTKNIDQPDISLEFGNFNYYNEDEMQFASEIFTKAGIEFIKRDEKPCNISFFLNFKELPKIKKQKRNFVGEEAINVVNWIFKKEYRKKIFIEPKNVNNGISTRGSVNFLKAELDEIRKQIKEQFNICVLTECGPSKNTDFFVITDKRAQKICEEAHGNLSLKNLKERLENSDMNVENVEENTTESNEKELRELLENKKLFKLLETETQKKIKDYFFKKELNEKALELLEKVLKK